MIFGNRWNWRENTLGLTERLFLLQSPYKGPVAASYEPEQSLAGLLSPPASRGSRLRCIFYGWTLKSRWCLHQRIPCTSSGRCCENVRIYLTVGPGRTCMTMYFGHTALIYLRLRNGGNQSPSNAKSDFSTADENGCRCSSERMKDTLSLWKRC